MMSRVKRAVWVVATLAITLVIGQFSGVRDYASQLRNGDATGAEELEATPTMAVVALPDNALMQRLKTEATRQRREPVDAKIDRVWKAIPGYNGLEVDLDATYRKAIAAPDRPIQYVYRQLAPKIHLNQLGNVPIYRGNPEKPMVSFMINVAWGNEFIVPILDTLDQEKVKATFFLDGSWLKKNPELAKEIQRRGHELSNHAYSHPNMSRLSRARAVQEIEKTEELLQQTLGVKNNWFAPPSGDFNQQTVDIAAEHGLKTVLWTLDTVDWKHPSPQSVVHKINSKVESGSLILMHPTDSSAAALKGMIHAIRSKGLVLGTVSQTLSPDRQLPAPVE
ncbi:MULTISPECIES: polysaccharide deacetylase family protein [Paenibacillus]|uniref:Polysaccharide deacetylase n=1 Tax=Paenibacillus polymyxa (strain SC2) TaxID=886882 RepID=E3EHG7_PAEPS|nr:MULTISPECIES: polysaccharide deacetylase family protein [Paenibacillus]ADO56120.1 polysaccharide deacetylase [Paenibacillus polymyxa SC2]WPQ58816.1 polysaccharide deacetylase family protein [Paenibacillus polymyxa]CCC84876.1 deacetylase-like protein [Paenibacillus polymyxa M1]